MEWILFFDWGNTIMKDFDLPGPMYLWEKVSWMEGAEGALKTLSDRYPCYMATNAPLSDREAVVMALKRIGADRYFRDVFSSRDIGFEKPDPHFFEAILKETGSRPGRCVMIGDNREKDIMGAKAAGMLTVFLNRKKDPGPFPEADAVIDEMIQLPSVIERICRNPN